MRVTGLEPARGVPPEPKSGASANSAIPAGEISIPFLRVFVNLDDGAHREWGACEASGICADAARAHKRVDTCGFHPLENHPFPLDSLAQTRDRRPLRNKGNGSRGYRCVAFSAFSQFTDNVLLHIRAIHLVSRLRRAADLCSSKVSGTA